MFIYIMDSAKASELGLAIIEGQGSQKYSLIVQEFSVYRNQIFKNKTVRIGIGVRLFILVKERTAKVNTLSIPAIAAKAEERKLEATIRLEVIGISGPAIAEAMPMPAELTFTTLMQMYKGIDMIKAAIWTPGTYVTPQILAFG